MKRRHFLSLSGMISGACLIPASVTRRIRSTVLAPKGPLFLAPEDAWVDLCAEHDGYGFTLHLGDPYAEPDYPTLRSYIETQGINPNKDEGLLEYAVECRRFELDCDEGALDAIAILKDELDQPIGGIELEKWMDWELRAFENPRAQAYHFLSDLNLKNLNCTLESHLGLGCVEFNEGHHGCNYDPTCYVDNPQALACLQHRLNELDEGVCIRIV